MAVSFSSVNISTAHTGPGIAQPFRNGAAPWGRRRTSSARATPSLSGRPVSNSFKQFQTVRQALSLCAMNLSLPSAGCTSQLPTAGRAPPRAAGVHPLAAEGAGLRGGAGRAMRGACSGRLWHRDWQYGGCEACGGDGKKAKCSPFLDFPLSPSVRPFEPGSIRVVCSIAASHRCIFYYGLQNLESFFFQTKTCCG